MAIRTTSNSKVPGSFRLGNLQDFGEVADAKLPVVEQEPQHLQPGFIGKNFVKRSNLPHDSPLEIHSYNRFYGYSQDGDLQRFQSGGAAT